MKLTTTNETGKERATSGTRLASACLACGQKIMTQISRAKEAIMAESSAAREMHRHALRLALNEAEALAWQTLYPHLVFPVLAAEKVQAAVAWDTRQRIIRRSNLRLSPVA